MDDYYTSPRLFRDLLSEEVYCTGTPRVNQKEVPQNVVTVKMNLEMRGVPTGEGYYIVVSPAVYVCW